MLNRFPMLLPLNWTMVVTQESVVRPPTAAVMRLDGGHPVLDLVNTVYGQVDGPVEHDVLSDPGDLVTFARRLDLAAEATPASGRALRAATGLRGAVDAVLRAQLDGTAPAPAALAQVESAARAALRAGSLEQDNDAVRWSWKEDDALGPVHRLAHAAVDLLGSREELALLHCCAGCRWLFLDRSRGPGRRWCSMADCGTEAKKRRYVERRRQLRRRQARAEASMGA
jgi:predicted RNA-binding Zn ribbon-like protein